MKKEQYMHYGCPNCKEPKTTIKNGQHISLGATVMDYGNRVRLFITCAECGYTKELTDQITLLSITDFEYLLSQGEPQ